MQGVDLARAQAELLGDLGGGKHLFYIFRNFAIELMYRIKH